ncbi:ArsA family ATPase [Sediminispirochaeta smaragdinae]|uniref:arsenite-transporting ATPase n=1 Tax=Sediminispirochaeta smaragdinae (strain DSM 11293 / JCM 15392 / SEBR 4228) TaxID=573413 RepID=E1RCN9_SEDSS|nr:ArsA family ATPase [Sediminispirochaeta smaragdinae]ADK80119.1 Arsenite-transporting ATPase [Sediminispirochaeta smaragdinae DSM 11293]
MPRYHIFVGKGGVGKSTCSCLEALRLASSQRKTLLDSMDPAHNLHDIFRTELGAKGKKILPTLTVRESDTSQKGREYMAEIRGELKNLYHYQQALNIDKYFNLLKFAPGMEEYAALLILQRCFDERRYDELVIDTPPTALTMKMLALPGVNLHWIHHLKAMREEILLKKNRVAEIHSESSIDRDHDPIFSRLVRMQKRYDTLLSLLCDQEQTEIVLVLNEDELSFSESLLIKRQLAGFGMEIGRIIVNKYTGRGDWTGRVAEAFPNVTILQNPLADGPLTGITVLNEHLSKLA